MFEFKMADFIPYKNKEVIERCRNIKREDMEKCDNPNCRIHIVPSPDLIWVGDMIARITRSSIMGEKLTMIFPNPCPIEYQAVADTCNLLNLSLKNVHIFTMDEWADQDGNVAPITYKSGFGYSCMKYFYGKIREDLRMPIEQMHYFTTENVKDYSKMIAECGDGGADVCYSGPGWAGHIAFIDPCTPEFACDTLDEFINMDARIVTLNPLTICQNSLHGMFGCSGDLSSVPPRAATIGPADVKRSKARFEMQGITTMGSFSSWQRMTSRLCLYGEITPLVPTSILRLWDTDIYVSEEIAKPIECLETVGY